VAPHLRFERASFRVLGARRDLDEHRRPPPPPTLPAAPAIGVLLDQLGLRQRPEVVARRSGRLADLLGAACGPGRRLREQLEDPHSQRMGESAHLFPRRLRVAEGFQRLHAKSVCKLYLHSVVSAYTMASGAGSERAPLKPARPIGLQVKHLEALMAIAVEGSFGGAARRLGYTQSAVTQPIAAPPRLR